MNKQTFLTFLELLVVHHTTPSAASLFPNIADITDATPEAASFFHGYFNATAWLSYFNPIQASYYDAVVGAAFVNRSQVVASFTEMAAGWGPPTANSTAYP
jgi:hypothetical protein